MRRCGVIVAGRQVNVARPRLKCFLSHTKYTNYTKAHTYTCVSPSGWGHAERGRKRLPFTVYRLPFTDYRLMQRSCRLLAVGYWLLAFGYWLLALGCWLLTTPLLSFVYAR